MSDLRERARQAYHDARSENARIRARQDEEERCLLARLLHRTLDVAEDAIRWDGQRAWIDDLCFVTRGSHSDRALYLVVCHSGHYLEEQYRIIVDLASLGREIETELMHADTAGHMPEGSG